MGFLQEMILTQAYGRVDDVQAPGEMFDDAQFLVLLNRVFGLILATLVLVYNWHE